ncbi:MAG: ChbG/HpnK family deacetylase [Limnohabitans sp.]|nr:ChbG/HpnK family deacetylase [Limnohabitans sp.]
MPKAIDVKQSLAFPLNQTHNLSAANPKSLVICADDFAASPAISQGIAGLASMQRIQATSVMVYSHLWIQHASMLKEHRQTLDVGLHLDWTSEFAFQAGHGLSLSKLMAITLLKQLNSNELKRIIQQQLDLFEKTWGYPPDHVDGHQHIQQFSGIRDSLVSILKNRYGKDAPWIRVSKVTQPDFNFKNWVINAMGASELSQLTNDQGLAHSDALSGVYDLQKQTHEYSKRMKQWLHSASHGTIIMCHPASAVSPNDVHGTTRIDEYEYLASDAFNQDLLHSKTQLKRGSALYKIKS